MDKLVTITKEVQLDAGHRVPNHESKCRNPHGHRYRVIAHCIGRIIEEPGAPDEGMVCDFSFLKHLLVTKVHDVLDHGFIVYDNDRVILRSFGFKVTHDFAHEDSPVISGHATDGWNVIVFPYIPTAENIARWAYEQLEGDIYNYSRRNMTLEAIEVWETPTSMAKYPSVPTHL